VVLAVTGLTAGVLAGGPVLLLALGGNPLPRRSPTLDGLTGMLTGVDADGRVLLWALSVTGWLAWAALAGCLLLEWAAVLTGRRAPRIPGLGGPQRLAGLLVAAALVGLGGWGVSPRAPPPHRRLCGRTGGGRVRGAAGLARPPRPGG
jgi:hypothetical protein